MVKEKKIIVVLFEGVYDLTKFAEGHPGGKDILEKFNGKNST
jgi:cytochrome b involved in lipid metabolism